MYSLHILNKSGRQSEAFEGRLIAEESNRDTSPETKCKWDAVRIYEKDPVWAKNREKEVFEETRKVKIIAPYTVGTMEGDLLEGGSNHYNTDPADDIDRALEIVLKKVPALHGKIKEQLSAYKAPQEVLDYVVYVKEKRERRRSPMVT